eukprot:Rmarinus@m.15347
MFFLLLFLFLFLFSSLIFVRYLVIFLFYLYLFFVVPVAQGKKKKKNAVPSVVFISVCVTLSVDETVGSRVPTLPDFFEETILSCFWESGSLITGLSIFSRSAAQEDFDIYVEKQCCNEI